MEKITEIREVDVYIANDGTRHRDERECLRYEQDRLDYKLLNGLHKMELKIFPRVYV